MLSQSSAATLPEAEEQPPLAANHGDKQDLLHLWRQLPARRRRAVVPLLFLIVLSGIAELASIGLIVPFLSLLGSGTGELPPVLQPLRERFGLETQGELVAAAAVVLVVAVLLANLLRLLALHQLYRWALGAGQLLSSRMFELVLARSYARQSSINSAQTIADLNKANVISIGFLLPLVQGAGAAVIALFIIAAMLAVDVLVALVSAVVLLVIYGTLLLATRGPMSRASTITAASWRKRTQLAQESIGGVRDVILDRTAGHFQLLYDESERRLRDAQLTTSFLAAAPRFLVEAAGFTTLILIALWLIERGQPMSGIVPTLGAIAVGAQRLLPLLQQSYAALTGFAATRQSIHDVAELLRETPSAQPEASGPPLAFNRELRLNGVTFRYPGTSAPVLTDVSLAIRCGERIGLFGPSGGGKSTLMDLLLGLQQPTEGRITVDGVTLDDEERVRWHLRVAHVPQNVFLADCSIAENIAFGVPRDEIDGPRLEAAVDGARVRSFVDKLPRGLDTRVGERGTTLSGGQRQRIGIARALYKDASLLVLDEITSALDSQTEQEIVQTISDLPTDRTVVIIAHRLSTLAHCDRWCEVSGGQVVEVDRAIALLSHE